MQQIISTAEREATEQWPQVRVLPLEGGRNFRDLGGYRTADGRRVRWGKLFRSGSLAGLTRADWEHLAARGVRAVCDFRSTRERESEPVLLTEHPHISYWARDYHTSFAELRTLLRAEFASGEAARQAMISGYRELPFDQSSGYRALFGYLKAGHVPLIFNCSAGKDRAGTAAALVLAALGVPRATVLEDFLFTNEALNLHQVFAGRPGMTLGRLPPEVIFAILHADPDYIGAALESIEARHGGVDGYLRDELDVSAHELAQIRAALLE
jgi:protein-tyrosine phosphatase